MPFDADGCAVASPTSRSTRPVWTGFSTWPDERRPPATPRDGPGWSSRAKHRHRSSGPSTQIRSGWPRQPIRDCCGRRSSWSLSPAPTCTVPATPRRTKPLGDDPAAPSLPRPPLTGQSPGGMSTWHSPSCSCCSGSQARGSVHCSSPCTEIPRRWPPDSASLPSGDPSAPSLLAGPLPMPRRRRPPTGDGGRSTRSSIEASGEDNGRPCHRLLVGSPA
jgi:hypothetical protein